MLIMNTMENDPNDISEIFKAVLSIIDPDC